MWNWQMKWANSSTGDKPFAGNVFKSLLRMWSVMMCNDPQGQHQLLETLTLSDLTELASDIAGSWKRSGYGIGLFPLLAWLINARRRLQLATSHSQFSQCHPSLRCLWSPNASRQMSLIPAVFQSNSSFLFHYGAGGVIRKEISPQQHRMLY